MNSDLHILIASSPLSPLGEGNGPSFNTGIPCLTQGFFVPGVVKIDPRVLKKKMKL